MRDCGALLDFSATHNRKGGPMTHSEQWNVREKSAWVSRENHGSKMKRQSLQSERPYPNPSCLLRVSTEEVMPATLWPWRHKVKDEKPVNLEWWRKKNKDQVGNDPSESTRQFWNQALNFLVCKSVVSRFSATFPQMGLARDNKILS